MQEEVTKHTRKIYHIMKKPGVVFWEKAKEITIEIFIIVFAVTLSIWFHNWSDHQHEQKETHEFLEGLKGDLRKDIRLLEENKKAAVGVESNFKFIRDLYDKKKIDTASNRLISDHLYFALLATHPNIGRYEGFKSSGKIGTIENDSLKQEILVYYQQTMSDLNDVEGLVNSFQTKILDMEVGKTDKESLNDLAKTFKMQALLQYGVSNLEGNIQAYDQAIQQAGKIISMIDQQSRHY